MKTTDFTTSILVEESPKKVFNAICKPQNWWSGEVLGEAGQLNDEFSYRYTDFHFSKQRVVEMVPEKKVVWLVTDSVINYVEDKQEWTGTKIVFVISEKAGKTLLKFSHIGLQPSVECFGSCSNAWTQLVQQSLFKLITTGEGDKLQLA